MKYTSNLQKFDSYKNKTAYQLGAFWYEAFTINNLSLETRVYKDPTISFISRGYPKHLYWWETNMGHPIGQNADEIFG